MILGMDCLATYFAEERLEDKLKARERQAERLPYKSDRIGTALTELGCAARTDSARLPQTTAASRGLGSVRLGYNGRWRCFSGEGKAPQNMCFCETNRIHLGVKTGDKILRWNRMRSKGVKIPIRFVWRENEVGAYSRWGSLTAADATERVPPIREFGRHQYIRWLVRRRG